MCVLQSLRGSCPGRGGEGFASLTFVLLSNLGSQTSVSGVLLYTTKSQSGLIDHEYPLEILELNGLIRDCTSAQKTCSDANSVSKPAGLIFRLWHSAAAIAQLAFRDGK